MINGFKHVRDHFLSVILVTIAAIGFLLTIGFSKTYPGTSKSLNMQTIEGELSSLKNANAWINSQGLTSEQLKGKVVLIQFCTYTCINWLRTLPYIRGWAQKYKDKGLVIIGVHTPEFSFEKNIDNVRRAIKDMEIDFPFAIDNDQEIWNAFNNQYWPALYLIDSHGHIRDQKFGEGNYEESEKVIQQLLSETGIKDFAQVAVFANTRGVEVAAAWENLNSAENYLGYERTQNFATSRLMYNKQYVYTPPLHLRLNSWALSGEWTSKKESIVLNKEHGKILYSFHARDLHLVMGPTVSGTTIRFRVLIDGLPPGSEHGIDIDDQGYGTITAPRLYQLIRQSNVISDSQFEIEFFDSGVEAFSFTFG